MSQHSEFDCVGQLEQFCQWIGERAVFLQTFPTAAWRVVPAGDAIEFVNAIAELEDRGADGIHFGINPMKLGTNGVPGNEDIACRHCLFLDVDHPDHDLKIPASDAGKKICRDVFERVVAYLGAKGWPAPVKIDSGNGYHGFWHIDLENDDESGARIASLLSSLRARFGPLVDTSVSDARRLGRVPGTWNKKGEPTADRPHRPCIIIDMPELGDVVTAAMIKAIIADIEGEPGLEPGHNFIAGKVDANGEQPGTDFNNRVSWAEILEPAGWKIARQRDKEICWTRPGKNDGVSATTGYCKGDKSGDLLYIFSSNAPPFESGTSYSKFYAFAILNHAGDFSAAAKDLAEKGYGAPRSKVKIGVDEKDDRRTVAITTKEMQVNTEAAMALAEHDSDLFQRCGALIRITEDGDEDGDIKRPPVPRIDVIPKETLREKLAAAVAFEKVKTTPEGLITTTPAHPPAWCVAAIHSRGYWPKVKRLLAVVNHPILRPDGTISQTGYDRSTGILGKWSMPIAVSLHPTAAEVRDAIKLLDDVIAEFEFVDASHRASWYAALFTPLARFAFEGAVPIFLVDANTRGAGKGLLLDCIALNITGENFAVMPYSSEEEEMRKKITSILLTAERLVLFDNLVGFGCSALDALVTAGRWTDRLLGGNKTVSLPIVATFYATGNNVITQGDLIRRIAHVRLETENEKPEQKTGFRYPDLRAHVKANRPALLSAALTILRAFADAGRPAQTLEPWGSFEAWSDHVRAPIVWAGMPDPAEARDMFQAEADSEADDLCSLLTAWRSADPQGDGLTAATAVEKAKTTNEGDLKSAIENLVGNLDSRKLGNRLRRIKRRVIGGLFFQKVGEVQRAGKWAVRTADRFRK
jgi:hypothetical protein